MTIATTTDARNTQSDRTNLDAGIAPEYRPVTSNIVRDSSGRFVVILAPEEAVMLPRPPSPVVLSASRLDDAKTACARIVRDAAAGIWRPEVHAAYRTPTLGDLAIGLLSDCAWRSATAATYRSLSRWWETLASMPVDLITIEDLQEWARALPHTLSARTRARLVQEVTRILDRARDCGYRADNPARCLTRPKRGAAAPQTLPAPSTLARAFDAWEGLDEADIEAGRAYYGHRLYFELQAHAGCRGGELCAMRWDRVVFDGHLMVIDAATEKTGRGRVVPLTDDLVAALAEHRRRTLRHGSAGQVPQATEDDGIVFPSSAGTISNTQTRTQRAWEIGMRAAGIPCGRPNGWTPHVLRYIRITQLAAAGHREELVSAMVGHEDPAMHRKYSRAFMAELRNVANTPFLEPCRRSSGVHAPGSMVIQSEVSS